jgi:hypothetical protein
MGLMAEAMSGKGAQTSTEDAPDAEQPGAAVEPTSAVGEATAKVTTKSDEPDAAEDPGEPEDGEDGEDGEEGDDGEADDDTAERPGIAPGPARPVPVPPRTAPRRPLGRPPTVAARPRPKATKDDGNEERPTDRLKRKTPAPDESGPRSPSRADGESEFTDTSIDTLDQKATLPSGAPRALAAAETPSSEPDADATAPYQLEQHGENPAMAAVAGPRAGHKTANALHSEDEDGPTLIAQYPSPKRPSGAQAEEATELMALATEPPAPPLPAAPAPNMTSSAPLPMTSSVPPNHHLRSQFMEREAAVQAALAAATGQARDPDALAAHRAHLFELATVGVLGAGAVLAAALSIIPGTDASKLNMPLAVALFLGGLVPLQRREPVKVALLALAGVLLFVAFVAMLVI